MDFTVKNTLSVWIDLQKAFDKVWIDGLLLKLRRCNISGNMFKWIKSYKHNRRARIVIDNNRSKKILLRHGVPQGGVLSPTLYIVFMNDLVKPLPTFVKSVMYADDLVMWSTELNVKASYTKPTHFQRFTKAEVTQCNQHNSSPPPCENTTRSIDIQVTVHAVTRDQDDTSKKLLTLSYIDDFYPQDTWIRIYTDGSATDAIQDGEAGSILYLPNGDSYC